MTTDEKWHLRNLVVGEAVIQYQEEEEESDDTFLVKKKVSRKRLERRLQLKGGRFNHRTSDCGPKVRDSSLQQYYATIVSGPDFEKLESL